jgi:hypothetical protein
MNFDLEHDVMKVAAELFTLVLTDAMAERATEAKFNEAVDHAIKDILTRHPDFSPTTVAVAMGVALGRLEERVKRKATRG